MKSSTLRLVAAIVLFSAGAWISGLLLAQHHGEGGAVTTVNELCGDGEGVTGGCEAVAASAWSSMAGVPLALLGLFFYGSLSLLSLLALAAPSEVHRRVSRIALGLLALGLLFDLYLLGLQIFAVHAYCWLCITTYVISGAAAAALWSVADPLGSRAAASQPAPPPAPDSPDDTLPAAPTSPEISREERLALAGWIVASLVLALGLASVEAALRERAKGRALEVIGAPLGEAPPAPATPTEDAPTNEAAPPPAETPSASVDASSASQWQSEAKRLQGILDDPEKLEQYFSDRAQAEFDAARPRRISIDPSRGKGAENAPVVVVEFSDFLCPFCRNLALALNNFIPQAGERVRVQFMNYPLEESCNPAIKGSLHPGACLLALGSICAHNQGKFWAYHDRVFSVQLQSPKPADVVRLAGEAGLNPAAIEGCLSDPQTKAKLAAEIAEGSRMEVSATPTLFINGKRLPRVNEFLQAVDKEARKKGFPPLPAAR